MRNDTVAANWLQVSVKGSRMNHMGLGARVAVYRPGMAGNAAGLLGLQEITLNSGYACSRPAMAHFGLGDLAECDVVVNLPLPAGAAPVVLRGVKANQLLKVAEAPATAK
jgi:hypothetical protein